MAHSPQQNGSLRELMLARQRDLLRIRGAKVSRFPRNGCCSSQMSEFFAPSGFS